jgi:hypothetical protein
LSPHACIFLGVDILHSTETLNFLCERKELISLIRLAENSKLDSLSSKLRPHVLSKAFSICSHRHIVVKIKGHVVLKPHSLQFCVVTCTETKLACIK